MVRWRLNSISIAAYLGGLVFERLDAHVHEKVGIVEDVKRSMCPDPRRNALISPLSCAFLLPH